MSNFWKGAFVPIQKHVQNVSFVSIDEMTNEDWKILDYGALRPSARANLDKQILSGRVKGFHVVDIDMHIGMPDKPEHAGKPRYYYPAADNIDESLEDFQTKARFGDSVDQENVDAAATVKMEAVLSALAFLNKDQVVSIIDALESRNETPYNEIDKSLELDTLRLIAVIGLVSVGPVEAKKILAPLDTVASDVYASLNNNE